MKTSKVQVVQPADEPEVPAKVLATAIRDMSAAVRQMNDAGLNRRAQILLIQDACWGVTKSQVKAVLDAMETLEKRYLR